MQGKNMTSAGACNDIGKTVCHHTTLAYTFKAWAQFMACTVLTSSQTAAEHRVSFGTIKWREMYEILLNIYYDSDATSINGIETGLSLQ